MSRKCLCGADLSGESGMGSRSATQAHELRRVRGDKRDYRLGGQALTDFHAMK